MQRRGRFVSDAVLTCAPANSTLALRLQSRRIVDYGGEGVWPPTRMSIREHPLAWRWTDADYAVLSEDTLAQLQPIEQREAEYLFQLSQRFLVRDNLSPQEFATIVRHSAEVPVEVGTRWLRELQSDLSVQVFISWQQDAAIRTTWEIFTAHWDDFCYPASDDVVVWPESECWALFYFHEQEFQFGQRAVP